MTGPNVQQPSPTRLLLPRGKRLYQNVSPLGTSDIHITQAYHEGTAVSHSIERLDATHIIVKGTDGAFDNFNIWNVADPDNAFRVGSWVGASDTYNDKFCVHGDFLIVFDANPFPDRLEIIDCSDRSNPYLVGYSDSDAFNNTEHIAIRSDGLGVAVGFQSPGVLTVFDASALPAITIIGSFTSGTSYNNAAYAVFFSNSGVSDRLMLTTFNNQVHGVNMTNPAAPVVYTSTTNTTFTQGCEFIGLHPTQNWAYTTTDNNSTNQRICRWVLTNPGGFTVSQFSDQVAIDNMVHFVTETRDDPALSAFDTAPSYWLYSTGTKTGGRYLARWEVTNSGSLLNPVMYSSPRIGVGWLCAMGNGLVFAGGATPIGVPLIENQEYFTGIQFP